MKKTTLLSLLLVTCGLTHAQNLQISGGNDFSAAVCANQVVFVWGNNAAGQLAGDTISGAALPATPITTPKKVKYGDVSNNNTGKLGVLPTIRQIDAGSGSHALGLGCAQQVWAWGSGLQGQLGRGTFANSHIPTRVLRGDQAAKVDAIMDPNGIYLHDIIYVSGGNQSSFGIEAGTGKVLAWGANDFGQLGIGTTVDQSVPRYVMKSAGVPLTNIVQIEGGDDCTYALDANGNVWSWGIAHDGTYAAWNLGRTLVGTIPAAAGGGRTCIPYAGQVLMSTPQADGTLDNGACNAPVPLSGIVSISGGATHALGLASDGTVWSWGGDWGAGQLGQGNGGQYKGCAGLVVDVSNAGSSVNVNGTVPTKLPLGKGVDGRAVYIAAGQASSVVVMANGNVVSFGANGQYAMAACPSGNGQTSGTLGTGVGANGTACSNPVPGGAESPVYVLSGAGTKLTDIVSVSDGDGWYFGITKTKTAVAWGYNRDGQLGLGNTSDRGYATAFSLPSGCSIVDECPPAPKLPADQSSCPVFNLKLDSHVPNTVTTWQWNWQYRATPGTGAWSDDLGVTNTQIPKLNTHITTGTDSTVNYVNQFGEYRVVVSDSRAYTPMLCAACPVYRDSIIITTFSNTSNCIVTSIDYENLSEKIKIIPNPSSGKFTASWFAGIPVTELLVHNALGQEIFRTNSSNGSSLDLDLGNVPKGIYMVTLKTHESKIVKRIIVE